LKKKGKTQIRKGKNQAMLSRKKGEEEANNKIQIRRKSKGETRKKK
jgi:hypothetical protein